MALSLYVATIPSYRQILRVVSPLLLGRRDFVGRMRFKG